MASTSAARRMSSSGFARLGDDEFGVGSGEDLALDVEGGPGIVGDQDTIGAHVWGDLAMCARDWSVSRAAASPGS